MKKAIITTLLISSLLLSGCGNNEAGNGNAAAPEQTGVETSAAPEITPAATAVATVQPTPEATTTAAPSPETTAEATPEPEESTRQVYFDKLDKIEEGLSDLKALSDEGTTLAMSAAAVQENERWDKALNEIYQVLKQQLSEAEMAKLKEEQRNWITLRDETAAKAAAKYEGGTAEGLEYAITLASVTRDRCYKLVELYMD